MKVLIVTGMYPTPNRPTYGTFVKEQVDSLREAGVDVEVFAFNGGGAKAYLKAIMLLHRKLRKQSYDLVHAHYGLSGLVARMQTRYPLVVTFHGSDLLGGVGPRYQYTAIGAILTTVNKLVGLTASKRIVVADILKSKLWGLPTVTIPMGVDLTVFKPMPPKLAREKLNLSHNKKRVLFIAHPENYTKRFDVAREAVSILQKTDPNIELLPIYNAPHHQVPLYINACDVLVLTSMHEASPCVIKEALACNLPVVSVDVGDVAKRLDGVAGCYLCHRTSQDMAEKLRLVLETNNKTNGREKIQHLSLQNIAQQVISVYQDVLDKKSRR